MPNEMRIRLPMICADTTARAASVEATMSPNPTVANTVKVK